MAEPARQDADEGLAVEVHDLEKSYGDTTALCGVSLSIPRGRTVALIGPNGAGKSTLVETLMGLRRPDRGRVTVLGVDVVKNPRAHVARLGVQLQDSRLFGRLSPLEYLEFLAGLHERSLPIETVVTQLNLKSFLKKPISELSGGQRQRVALALAIVNDPELVILDEPTVGLDPITRREFWGLIRRLGADGKSILFSTHYMEEAQALADEITMISRGRVVAQGTWQGIVDQARLHGDARSLDDAFALLGGECVLEQSS